MHLIAVPGTHRKRWLASIAMLLGCAFACSWLALAYGRDVSWDYHNYHAYAAWLLGHDRLGQDFFAAGPQGYMNPIGFLPLALTQYYWHLGSMPTAVVLACLHSLSAFFLYLICRDLAAGRPWPEKLTLAMGWLLGVSTPVFLLHLGSTSIDPIGSALVLAATWLAVFRPQPRMALLAGLLAGVAMAAKLSNVVFALAVAAAIALPWHEKPRTWMQRTGSGAIGMLLGFIATQGWWSWRLLQTTGNPFFPFFNGIFRSPYFITESAGQQRFQPTSLGDLLTLPWRMAQGNSWAYIELSAPTVVPLAICVALVLLGVVHAGRLLLHRGKASAPAIAGAGPRFAAAAGVSAALWLATSANGRYGITLFLLLGPALALLLLRLLPRRYAALVACLLALLQGFTSWQMVTPSNRWGSSQWTPQFEAVRVPDALKRQPLLFVSLANPSHSEIVPYLHPDSAFVRPDGTYSIPSDGPAYERLQSLLSEYDGRTQVLFPLASIKGLVPNVPRLIERNNIRLDRIGLRIQGDHCLRIEVGGQQSLPTRFNSKLDPPPLNSLMSCSAGKSLPDPALAKSRESAERIMDAFEDKCPDLLRPRKPQIEALNRTAWRRMYLNYDAIALFVSFDKDVIMYNLSGQSSPAYLGKASEWPKAVAAFHCQLPGEGMRGIGHFEKFEKDAYWH